MRFTVLGSGSAGNAAVVEAAGVSLLVDAGLSARQLLGRMAAVGVNPAALDAVVLTHEHMDHARGLPVLMKQLKLPVYATVQTAEVLRPGLNGVNWRCFEAGQSFAVGDLLVESFRVMHDAVDPVGFVFRGGSAALGFLSDAGHVPEPLCRRLGGLDLLFLEANYDQTLLESDTKRPWSTKQRISSRHGHLSNEQAAQAAAAVAHSGMRRVVLGHLSRDCNQPGLAVEVVRGHLAAAGWPQIEVGCAGQDEPTPWWGLA